MYLLMCSNVSEGVTDFEVLLVHQKDKNLNSPGRNGVRYHCSLEMLENYEDLGEPMTN